VLLGAGQGRLICPFCQLPPFLHLIAGGSGARMQYMATSRNRYAHIEHLRQILFCILACSASLKSKESVVCVFRGGGGHIYLLLTVVAKKHA